MLRRLYFLLPDEAHAKSTVQELLDMGITDHAIHAMTREGIRLEGLPQATDAQRRDLTARIEQVLWYSDLGLFFIALAGFILAAYSDSTLWMIITALIMVATFLLGERFTTLMPKTHLDNFREAMSHGEILLMVDLPFYLVASVDKAIRHHHPEATAGGSCWHINAFGS
jgi:hypothetical protein